MADECCCSMLACRTSAFANHEGHLTTRWSGPGILRKKEELIHFRGLARHVMVRPPAAQLEIVSGQEMRKQIGRVQRNQN